MAFDAVENLTSNQSFLRREVPQLVTKYLGFLPWALRQSSLIGIRARSLAKSLCRTVSNTHRGRAELFVSDVPLSSIADQHAAFHRQRQRVARFVIAQTHSDFIDKNCFSVGRNLRQLFARYFRTAFEKNSRQTPAPMGISFATI